MPGPPPPTGAVTTRKWTVTPERKAPAKSAYPLSTIQEYSFEYWFNYFYDEIPNPVQQKEFFLQISPAEGTYLKADQIRDDKKKELLSGMMKLGFLAYPASGRITAEDMFESMRSKQGPPAKAGYQLQDLGIRVVFRGDARTPNKIKAVDGTKPQTRVAELAGSRNFDKTWHPWNDAARANLVYFRKGPNQDNCLFSAISVTPNFEVATKFPLLNDLRATNPAAVGTVMVEAERLAAPAAGANRVASLRERFDGTKLPGSKTNVYVVKVKGGWNTEAFQSDAFPERAFENLKWAHHYALLKVLRIHYSDNMNDGHLIVVEGIEWLQEPPVLTQRLGVPAYHQLKTYMNEVSSDGKLAPNGTGGIDYAPPGVIAPLKIKRVLKFSW